MKIFLICLAIICILSTLIPFIVSKKWWIRAFDFPHLQFSVLNIIVIISFVFFANFNTVLDVSLLVLLVFALVYQLKIIYPYTSIARKQIANTSIKKSLASIRVFSANVLQDNHDFDQFLTVFKNVNPDIAILLETNSWWQNKLSVLKDDYPYTIEYPLENYYGIILLSKFKLKSMEVKFLVDDTIPSIHGKVQLKNGTWVKIYCLHPMPPSPTENEKSLDRDAELLIVAKEIKKEDYPVIVLGDLNDVAWSHTTRMFQRISQLLDPRIGRGFYNTFHANYPIFRWPLDHLFVSDDFKLAELRRLENIGSDHFPMFAELCHDCDAKENTDPDKASKEDKTEAKKTIKEGLEENGKSPG
ncbi:MAG: endonuclease/exonuclease/phosphatase family protein [Flavobacteriaceae bacterium]|nr:endonuclease/exonuclease/phosphatase family protein [Flavobacteriaceae bacterium]